MTCLLVTEEIEDASITGVGIQLELHMEILTVWNLEDNIMVAIIMMHDTAHVIVHVIIHVIIISAVRVDMLSIKSELESLMINFISSVAHLCFRSGLKNSLNYFMGKTWSISILWYGDEPVMSACFGIV